MILKFKSGSGIKIKPSHKGLFTKYCKGKVTNECILRGKNSSDPAVRRRATFAANARKWSHHKQGGKAFVNGVNVLDSNPDMYKRIKKRVSMKQSGGKVDWASLALIGVNAFSNIMNNRQQNNAIKKLIEANNIRLKSANLEALSRARLLAALEVGLKMERQRTDFNNGISFELPSQIVARLLEEQLANKYAQDEIASNTRLNEYNLLELQNRISLNLSDLISGIASLVGNWGIDALSKASSKKPNTVSNITTTNYTKPSFNFNLDFASNWKSGLTK